MKYQFLWQEPSFTVGNIDIQSVSRPKDYTHSFRNGRAKHGFIYIVKGRMCDRLHTEDRRTIYADAGDLVFMPKGSVYSGTYLEEGTEIRIVQFDILRGALPTYLSAPQKLPLKNAGELIDAFFVPSGASVGGRGFYFLACLYTLLFRIGEGEDVPAEYRRLRPALCAFADGWREDMPVSHYAELCHMSEVNFRRLFRECTGMPPVEYRNDLRLAHARAMLRSGEYNVSETAALCGFSNLSFFTRLYKKKYGHTPKCE